MKIGRLKKREVNITLGLQSRLDEELIKEINDYVHKNRISSVSEFIRMAIKYYLRTHVSPCDTCGRKTNTNDEGKCGECGDWK